GAATLEISIPSEIPEIHLRLRLWDLDGQLPQQNVTVAVDGMPIRPQTSRDEGISYDTVCRPVRNGSALALRLAITSTTVTFSGDPRTLGVPIRSIRISPAAQR